MGFMKHTVKMGSGALVYIPSFIKIGSGLQTLLMGIHIPAHRQQSDLICLLLFLKNKEIKFGGQY
jgi:hypothetical protein